MAKITIELDSSDALTTKIIDLLTSSESTVAAAPKTTEPAAPAEKAPVAPKRAPKETKAPVAEPEPEPEATEDDEEDLISSGPTVKDAVEAATKAVSSGNSTAVRAALTSVGVKKVSELKDAQVAEFLEALDA